MPPTMPIVPAEPAAASGFVCVSPTAAPAALSSAISRAARPTATSQPKNALPQLRPPNSSRCLRWTSSSTTPGSRGRAGASRSAVAVDRLPPRVLVRRAPCRFPLPRSVMTLGTLLLSVEVQVMGGSPHEARSRGRCPSRWPGVSPSARGAAAHDLGRCDGRAGQPGQPSAVTLPVRRRRVTRSAALGVYALARGPEDEDLEQQVRVEQDLAVAREHPAAGQLLHRRGEAMVDHLLVLEPQLAHEVRRAAIE